MPKTNVLAEAKRLYGLGFAVHWLHQKSKRPVETKWTTGPRKTWAELEGLYRDGYNVGVRLGKPSKLENGYLGCIDFDVKDVKYRDAALEKLYELIGFTTFPEVRSGGGNGSRHLYFVSQTPFDQITFAKSKEKIEKNGRKSHVWEIVLYSTGRQMALPPSVHPDSGKLYEWKHSTPEFPLLDVSQWVGNSELNERDSCAKPDNIETASDFEIEPVELAWLDISDAIRKGISAGDGVSDRSAFLLPACSALFSAGLTKNEILTVLTDPKNYLSHCAYEHAQTKSRKAAARWLWRYSLKKIIEEKDAKNVFEAAAEIEEAPVLSEEQAKAQTAELELEFNWQEGIKRGKHGGPQHTVENVILILTKSFGTSFLKRDEFSVRDTYTVDTPWYRKANQSVGLDDLTLIRCWVGKNFGFEPSKDLVHDALTVVACENAYDPVKNWIDGLEPWDGKRRLNGWLKENFNAKGDPAYLAQVFRKWLVAVVMRIYEPGAKFDWMPIFEGIQGIGKSSFGRLLCGEQYFQDWLPNLSDKDAALALQGRVMVEMGELATMRKNEIDVVKAFITRTIDKVRPPYGRLAIEIPRRCVFFGTTNRETYLKDDSGNRRFKPVIVGRLNFRALERDRNQLFAEAKHLWDSFIETHYTLDLRGKARTFELEMHHQKMVKDDSELMAEVITDYLETHPEFDTEKMRIHALFGVMGPLQKFRLDNRNSQLAAKALKMIGGEKKKIKGYSYWKLEKGEGEIGDF